MENNNEEIVASKLGTTKNGYNFMRVDFDNPSTIRNYGEDIENSISNVFLVTSEMLPDEGEINIDEKKISQISNFGNSLEQVDKKNVELQNPLIKIFTDLLEKIGIKKDEEVETQNSYKAQYSEYLKSLNEICSAVESQMKSELQEFDLKRELVSKITPLVEALSEIIEVGKIDRNEFEKYIMSLNPLEVDLLTQMKIQATPDLLSLFDAKLNKLEKDVIIYKNQIYAYYLQAIQDQMIIESQKQFLSSKPTLMAQGSLKVINKVQEKRIKNMQDLNKSLNEMISGNAVQLEKNAKSINTLQSTQGVTIETLKLLDSSLKSGIKVYRDSKGVQRDRLLSERKFLNELNNNAESYKKEVLLITEKTKVEGVVCKVLK